MNLTESENQDINNAISGIVQQHSSLDDAAFRKIISRAVSQTFTGTKFSLKEKQEIVEYYFRRIRGFDVLQPLIDDECVTEIMVNGPDNIFYENAGVLCRYDQIFESRKRLTDVIMHFFAKENRNICESDPIADVRLEDGSRANAVLYPVAPDGPILTIRKFTGIKPDMDALLKCGFLTAEEADYLISAIKTKKNIFISGGTGTGKTTFLNVLSGFIPSDERIITIEDSSELKLQNTPNLVRLEARQAAPDGSNEITVSDLIRCALRMRPDRIIVGEVRGKEASDMLWAMNTGHLGSLSTGHSNSAVDMISRLCIMIQQSSSLPVDLIKKIIASAVNIIVHLKRLPGGGRCIEDIIEIISFQEGEFKFETVSHKNP
ncbi:MAG: CpaF family protein [Saccharofermentanales bacterium]